MDRASWTKADYQVAIVYSIVTIILVYYIFFDWGPYILHRLSLQFEKRSVLQALSEEIARDEKATPHKEETSSTPKAESLAAESDPSGAAHTVNPKYRLDIPLMLHPFPTNKASTRESDDHSKASLVGKNSTPNPPKFKIKSKPNDGRDADLGSQLMNPSRSNNENLRGGLNVNSIEARLHQSIMNERVWTNAQAFGFHDIIDSISNFHDANNAAWGDNVNIDTRAPQDAYVRTSNAAIRVEQDREYYASMEEDQKVQAAKQALQSKQEMAESRRMLLRSSLRSEPVEDKSNRDIITLSFRCKTASSMRFNRRFSASATTAGELLDYIEGLELRPLLESSFKLQLDFPLRVICRSITETESKLLDLGIDTDSVVHVMFDDDEVFEG